MRITLTIETEEDEDPRQKLLEFLEVGKPVQGKGVVEWTPEDFTSFWGKLQPDARQILGVVAKQPDGCPMDAIQKALSWSGLQVAGRLSSVGHAMRQFPGRPYPYEWDARARVYKLNRPIAEWIARLASGRKAA